MFTRDPVSVWWDKAARAALGRAVRLRGGWYATRIADPSARQRASLLRMGIDWQAPDTARGRAAKTRWARAFVRSIHYAADERAVQVEIGRRVPARGLIPAGRAVRIRTRVSGAAAVRAAGRLPESRRIFGATGAPGARWADPALRDW